MYVWMDGWMDRTFWHHCRYMFTTSFGQQETSKQFSFKVGCKNQQRSLSVSLMANVDSSQGSGKTSGLALLGPTVSSRDSSFRFNVKAEFVAQHGPTVVQHDGASQSCSFARLLEHLGLTLHNAAQRAHLRVFPPSSFDNIHRIPPLAALNVDTTQTPFAKRHFSHSKTKQGD